MICWHADTIALDRHAVQVAIQLRLAVWILVGLLVERGYAFLRFKLNEGEGK
jgi:hypothetical protein